jgi:uncharacterized protein (TIGR02444 family)
MTDFADEWPASPLWTFSLELYSQPEVEAACLALQDDHGLDVNLVLLAAWLARSGRGVEAPLAQALRKRADAYQTEVMQPFRQARRALKRQSMSPPLAELLAERRRCLLATELDLEHLEQLMLEKLAGTLPGDTSAPPATLFARNLAMLYPDRSVPESLLAPFVERLRLPEGSANSKI